MNTAFLLMAQFNKAIVPLDEISEEYFALAPRTAQNYAKAGRLPVPAFRGGEGNKAPWLVNINDLAAYLDKQRDAAAKDQVSNQSRAA
ncbi:pyocin activator PrtN family protein [Shewanella xiamenensis]|uniref:pyocin activator PrtN family protein n=1 Tax=Shewanella xiamenensis TaxID=332186 RepID=UPI00217E357E|nr:pyocin activator PrtN family protein [Shewanella xiamenensis]MCT8874170.1 pyocin activator PrtN family protein [Shewanella xiamenensis]UWH42841.1 pyocin activator PrtN family protein [Shewanella xiamenensis]